MQSVNLDRSRQELIVPPQSPLKLIFAILDFQPRGAFQVRG